MPKAAPTHKRHQPKAHKRPHRYSPPRDTALHGTSAWRKFSLAYRRSNPLCVYCLIKGRTKLATDVDHIIPHNGEPTLFWMDGNYQSLCKDCHGYKRSEEAKPQNIPTYVQCSPAWTQVISGPPASGKTTEASRIQAERGGIIYDLDVIAEDIGLPRYDRTWEQAKVALHHRNFRLKDHPSTQGMILIQSNVTAPQRARMLDRFNASFTHMTTPETIRHDRVNQRET